MVVLDGSRGDFGLLVALFHLSLFGALVVYVNCKGSAE